MGYIYLITNKIHGMKYVGQTKCPDIRTRWKQHQTKNSGSVGRFLKSAYEKYGYENFKYQIICICFDEDCDKYEEE
jgi:group I intron endonuclease